MKFQGICVLAVVAVGVTAAMVAADPKPPASPVLPAGYSVYQPRPQATPSTGLLSRETIKKLLADNPDLVPTLLATSKDESDSDIRNQAVMAVAGLGEEAVPALLKMLQESEDEAPLMCLIYAATKPDFPIEDVVPVLLTMSKSENAERRKLAKYGLSYILSISTNPKMRATMSQQLAESMLN